MKNFFLLGKYILFDTSKIMVIWAVFDLTVATVGTYNLIKGIYEMYGEATKVKKEYKVYKRRKKEYKRTQGVAPNPLTQSQFSNVEKEFLLVGLDKANK